MFDMKLGQYSTYSSVSCEIFIVLRKDIHISILDNLHYSMLNCWPKKMP